MGTLGLSVRAKKRTGGTGTLGKPEQVEGPIKNLQRDSETLLAAFSTAGEVRAVTVELPLRTATTSELIDITDQVRALVTEADIAEGLALVASPHTTCAIIVNENEPGFARDFVRALERLAPVESHYDHNDAPHDEEDEGPNGYAHVRAAFLSSPSVMLPIKDGALALGRWQRIFFVELDRGRTRRAQITLLGRA